MENITSNTGLSISGGNTSMTDISNLWQFPELLHTQITEEGVEQVFRENPSITYTTCIYPYTAPDPRIYKNIYRIVDGKLILIKRVEGRYIPPTQESYTFDNE